MGSSPSGPSALGQALCAPCSVLNYRSPVPLPKFQMAPILSFLISSGSKKKEHRYACLSEAKSSHSHKMCTEVSPSVPHFLQVGLLLSPITYKCLLRVLCLVRRPITTLDRVLLKDNNRALVARLGPEVNSQSLSLCTTGTTPQIIQTHRWEVMGNSVHVVAASVCCSYYVYLN